MGKHLLSATFGVIATIAFVVLLRSAASANEYYKVFSNAVEYIAWTEDSTGHLTGQYQEEIEDSSDLTKFTSNNSSFTGIRNGSDVSITFQPLSFLAGVTWTGTIGWHSLTLVRSIGGTFKKDTFSVGSYDDYHAAAQRLWASVNAARTNQAQQEQAAAAAQAYHDKVITAVNDFAADLGGVSRRLAALQSSIGGTPTDHGLLATYQSDLAKMTTDLAIVQKLSGQTINCLDQYQLVGQPLYQVTGPDYYAITGPDEYNRSQLANAVQDNIEHIKRDIDLANADWPTISSSSARSLIHSSGGNLDWSDAQFSKWKTSSRSQVQYFTTHFADLNSQYISIEQQAKVLNDQASALPSSIKCK